MRYLAYAQPFLFAVWGIGLASLWTMASGAMVRLKGQLASEGFRLLSPPAAGRAAATVLFLAGLFTVLANPAWLRSVTQIADITVPPELPSARWDAAASVLDPWLEQVDAVVTTDELGMLYYYGRADYLFSADLVPMCSPALLSGRTRLSAPEDILKYPLVHEFNYEFWGRWFELAGVSRSAVNLGPIIDDPNVLIGAALGLQGFVLGPPLFYREHIKSGMLITPLGEDIRIPIDYYFLVPTAGSVSKETLQLKNWVMDEVSKFHAEEPESLPDRRRTG